MTIVSDYRALLSGSYWFAVPSGGPVVATPQPMVLTYSFSQTASAAIAASNPAAAATFQAFSAADEAVARDELQQWAAVCGITFIETTESEGDLNFGYYDFSKMGYGGYAGLGNYPWAGAYIDAGGTPGLFGPAVEVGPEASAFERVLARSGRDPHWPG